MSRKTKTGRDPQKPDTSCVYFQVYSESEVCRNEIFLDFPGAIYLRAAAPEVKDLGCVWAGEEKV